VDALAGSASKKANHSAGNSQTLGPGRRKDSVKLFALSLILLWGGYALADPPGTPASANAGHRAALLENSLEALDARRFVISGDRPFVSVYSLGEDRIGYLIGAELVRAA